LPLPSYEGTYGNVGYGGSFTLCAPNSTSHYCHSVLSAFEAVDSARSLPLPPDNSIPQLKAAWPRIWSSHLRLVHTQDNKFDVSATALFPEGYGVSKTPFETSELDNYVGYAEFVLDDSGSSVIGFGFYGVDPGMDGVPGRHETVQESCIAWFPKTI